MTALDAGPVTTVMCPPWCKISQREHLADVSWKGHAVHWSDEREGEGWKIWHSSITLPDGTPTDAEPKVYVAANDGLTREGAEALALALLAAYEEAEQ